MPGWNVLATSPEGRRDALLIALRRLGKFRRGGYRNVVIGEVADHGVFLGAVRDALATDPLLPTALAKLVPIEAIVRIEPAPPTRSPRPRRRSWTGSAPEASSCASSGGA
jgi:hypothetical protein